MNQNSIINIVNACNKININAFFVYWAISASPLFKKTMGAQNRRTFSPSFIVYYFNTFQCVWPALSSSVQAPGLKSVCPLKSIRIPAQEGWLGFSAAWAEGQRAAGGEERWRRQSSRKERKRVRRFLGRFPAARFWSVRLAPCSLGPVEQSTARLRCNWASSFHKENGTGTPRRRWVQIPRRCVDFCFLFKTLLIFFKKEQLYTNKILLHKKKPK